MSYFVCARLYALVRVRANKRMNEKKFRDISPGADNSLVSVDRARC